MRKSRTALAAIALAVLGGGVLSFSAPAQATDTAADSCVTRVERPIHRPNHPLDYMAVDVVNATCGHPVTVQIIYNTINGECRTLAPGQGFTEAHSMYSRYEGVGVC